MTIAKISLPLAALMIGARSLSDDVRKAVVKQVFDKVKSEFGIPDEHKLKVEIDAASDPMFLTLVRKKNGATYPLRSDGMWVDAPVPKPVDTRKWFKVDSIKFTVMKHMRDIALPDDEEIQVDPADVADLDASGSDFVIKGDVAYIKLNPSSDF
jgi:hypothetical protein